jgi:hypothetical protein
MSANDKPDPAIPTGYRTLVPGKGEAAAKPAPATLPSPPNAGAEPAKPGAPATKPEAPKAEAEKPDDDPTRYGDWQVKGRCIDF